VRTCSVIWQALAVLLCAGAGICSQGQIGTNEIHYGPDAKTELVEFVELYNPGTGPVDMTDWRICRG